MDNCRTENIVEANENTNIQCDRRPPVVPVLPVSPVLGARGGIDSSLLFFFLLLVCIVCQSDCGIEMDTLLWFFLLLVVIYNMYD
ncbi:hypothetical protein SDC9_98445 [bioreactor metagenome]|jgi:hypothetical protein|uniref:Transmembrane protein n=3 Tax=root TaxID=1 RepID=A0A562JE53_9FIRM|nr:hypothetical protein [Sedimentibacter saalensis]MEA5094808.1 hypothetical protein [Sedimentibacter saalensis]TWH81431.1 hypothetical protein LY60_01175 [Sedimentibacter saalensis]